MSYPQAVLPMAASHSGEAFPGFAWNGDDMWASVGWRLVGRLWAALAGALCAREVLLVE